MKRTTMTSLAVAAMMGVAGAGQAALIDRGGGLIYDTDLNITWLQDANYAQTSGYDGDGLMWAWEALNWVTNLTYHDALRNTTYDDWRLPTVLDVGVLHGCDDWSYSGAECGFNVSLYANTSAGSVVRSELAYMFYVTLNNTAIYDTQGVPQAGGLDDDPNDQEDESLFANLLPETYWAGETGSYSGQNSGWLFNVGEGHLYTDSQGFMRRAWAVRDGDVLPTIPEPTSLTLFGIGLAGLLASRRRSS